MSGRSHSSFLIRAAGWSLLGLVSILVIDRASAAQPELTVELDGEWSFHSGDNPAWAAPEFDDSRWPRMGAPAFSDIAAPRWRGEVFWYRQRVATPRVQDLSIAVGPIDGAYEVYINGKKIGGLGRLPPHLTWYSARRKSYLVPDEALDLSGYMLIALRVYRWPVPTQWFAAGTDPVSQVPVIGSESALDRLVTVRHQDMLLDQFPGFFNSLLCLVVGLVALELFRRDRNEFQNLWLGLAFVFTACHGFFGLLSPNTTALGVLHLMMFDCPTLALEQGAAILFLGSCISRRPPLAARLLAAIFVTSVGLLLFGMLSGSNELFTMGSAIDRYCLFATVVLGIVAAAHAVSQRTRSSIVLAAGVTAWETSLIWGFRNSLGPRTARTAFEWGPFSIRVSDVGVAVFALCMFYVLVQRFLALREERERLGREFEAARRIQALLVPSLRYGTPGYVLETSYEPAQEVGGDFYQVLPGDDGSMLVVVGDVSGKGLKAAMLVAHIIGGLRCEPSRQPAEVLSHLNRALSGETDGGFVTCACALLSPNGCATLANAGHIYPYRNGEELEVPSGLPLGVISDPAYPETRVHLEPGDRLTFVSDGVIEARNSKGELFGFDRVKALTLKTATEVSKAAQAFGQQDDITVVSIVRA